MLKKGDRFLDGRGRWVRGLDAARDFQHVVTAIMAAQPLPRHDLEVLLDFGDPQYDVRLPLGLE